jgi:nucleoside-diphosphate-sugar epimerase
MDRKVDDLKKLQQKTVIIFGANGFLGSVITRKLYNSGFQVLPVIRPGANKSRLNDLAGLKILEVDPKNWPQIIKRYMPSVVICAQWSGVFKQDRENYEIQDKNIEPILKLAVVAKEISVGTFICLGSQAEAKESTSSIQEIYYNSGKTAYGSAKANLHSQLESLFKSTNSRFIWARVFSVYGPSDYSDSLSVQLFESEIAGNEFVVSNPSKFWSYLYEDDFASAIEHILKNLNIWGCVNVGNPIFMQVREIVAIWQKSLITDPIHFEFNETNIGFFPDTGKLTAVGWEPSISLEVGIQRTREEFTERNHAK